MTILRACIVCAKPSPGSYCVDHKPKPWQGKRKSRITVSGWDEQRRAKRILAKYMGCCHVCGKVGTDETMDADHVIPISDGGADEEWNLAPICREPCHRQKTAAESRRARA